MVFILYWWMEDLSEKWIRRKMKYLKPGRFNLKGKKSKQLSCGCCDIINFKEEILKKIVMKEMKDEIIQAEQRN